MRAPLCIVSTLNDLSHSKGSIFADASPAHAASALAGVIMTSIFIVTLLCRPRSSLFGKLRWASLPLLSVYFLSACFINLYRFQCFCTRLQGGCGRAANTARSISAIP